VDGVGIDFQRHIDLYNLSRNPIDKKDLCRIEGHCDIRDHWQSINRVIINSLAHITLEEVDPVLLQTYEKLGIPLHERARLAGVEGAGVSVTFFLRSTPGVQNSY